MAQAPDTFGFVAALSGTAPTFRRRLGTVVSVETGYTMTVKLAGDSTSVSGVRYLGTYPPQVGSAVWIDTDGADLLCIGAVAGNGGAACSAKVGKGAVQTIAASTSTVITWAAGQIAFDPFGLFDDANDRWVVPFDGIYRLTASLEFNANTTTAGSRGIFIRKGAVQIAGQRFAGTGSTVISTICSATVLSAAVKGDTFDVQGWQTSGVDQTVSAGEYTHFAIDYVGPAS